MNLNLFVPELTLAGFTLAVILLDMFVRQASILRAVALIGLIASGALSIAMWNNGNNPIFANMLAVDNFAVFFKVLFIGIAFLVILSSSEYADKFDKFKGEYYALILLSTLGMYLMAATTDLIAIYVALELTSISLYVLVSFLKDRNSTEGALKYLLLGAIASATLLFGMSFVFGVTGSTNLGGIAQAIQGLRLSGVMDNPALLLGIIMMIAGFGFKMAAVPFQMWVPDVYEGAPTTVTAFLSVGSKAAGFAMVMRVFYTAFGLPGWFSEHWALIFAALSILSMVVGNVAAIPQTNIKRLLGYSSIAQAGYLMVGLATLGAASSTSLQGQSGIMFFLASYALTNLGAFVAIIIITGKTGSDLISDFAGMGKRSPLLALGLTLPLISLIGMPPASGFMAKFYIFSSAADNGLLWLVIVAAINSVISAFYYLRVVKVMWFGTPAKSEPVPSTWMPRLALALCSIGVLLLGIIPGAVMHLAELAGRIFTF